MLVLPPLPPKDYELRKVKQTILSYPDHTPHDPPRITQNSLGVFCYPIEYGKHEKLNDVPVPVVNAQILDKWVDEARAFWVDRPGKNDYFLHDMYKKYSMVVNPSYDHRYMHKEHVFNRSFNYEMDCMEYARQQKLLEKFLDERDEERRIIASKEKPPECPFKIVPCKEGPPFWWKLQADLKQPVPPVVEPPPPPKSRFKHDFLRWQEEPDFLKPSKASACQRRDDMMLVTQLFRNEAINFYYKHHPPPQIKHISKRFA